MNPNSNVSLTQTFTNQQVLNQVPRDPDMERAALGYLDKHAPDLVGVIMGHLL